MSLIPYCEGCRWNNGCFNDTCMKCHCGSKYEHCHAQYQQEPVIKRNDALDYLIYAYTARGNGKSRYLYEKMKQSIEDGAQIHMVRKNGRTLADMDRKEIKERLNMIFGNPNKFPEIKNVIFNDPATIVFWSDGSKTVVKAHNEEFDPEKGLAMAICKRIYGNKGNFNNLFKKWLPEEYVKKDPVRHESDREWETKHFTVKMFAERFNISESTVRRRLRQGEYRSAFKQDGVWIIPVKFMKKK